MHRPGINTGPTNRGAFFMVALILSEILLINSAFVSHGFVLSVWNA